MMVIGDEQWTDYEVSLDVRLELGTEYAVGVRWRNEQTFYRCSHTVAGVAGITKLQSGQTERQLAAVSSMPLPAGEVYHWRIVVQGSTVTLYVEGDRVVTATDSDSPIASGKVALLVSSGCIADFDNVRITQIGG